MAKKKPIVEHMGDLVNLVNNKEVANWAKKLDAAGHGAKAAAKPLRKSLMETAKLCKRLRAEIQDRKLAL